MIFNLHFLLVAIIIMAVVGPTYLLFPGFMAGEYGDITCFGLAAFVCIVTELLGLKARLFFLPLWLLALVSCAGELHEHWGWAGIAAATAAVTFAAGMLLLRAWQNEKKEWEEAPARLAAARGCTGPGRTEEMWDHMAAAYLVPVFTKHSPLVCRHNLEVLAFLQSQLSAPIPQEQSELIGELDEIYNRGAAHGSPGEPIDVDGDLTNALEELITDRGVPKPVT